MIITTPVKMELSRRGVPETVSVMQDDKYSRNIAFALYDDGLPWTPPGDATAVVRYLKPDGTGGSYNTLPDGSEACAITDNILTVALAPQVCTVPGVVRLTAAIVSGSAELHTFTIQIHVCANPGLSVTSEDYYKVSGTMPVPATAQVGQYLRVKAVDENGRVTAVEAVDINVEEAELYKYSGREFPPIPNAKYPYAMICQSGFMGAFDDVTFTLFITAAPLKAGNSSIYADGKLAYALSNIDKEDGSGWDDPSYHEEENFTRPFSMVNPIWANYDILNTDGTVYLAASEPVPVYENTENPGNSGGTGLAVIDLSSTLSMVGNPPATSLRDAEAAAFDAVVSTKMPCIVRFKASDGEMEVYFATPAIYAEADGIAMYMVTATGGYFQFTPWEEDNGWLCVYNGG